MTSNNPCKKNKQEPQQKKIPEVIKRRIRTPGLDELNFYTIATSNPVPGFPVSALLVGCPISRCYQ